MHVGVRRLIVAVFYYHNYSVEGNVVNGIYNNAVVVSSNPVHRLELGVAAVVLCASSGEKPKFGDGGNWMMMSQLLLLLLLLLLLFASLARTDNYLEAGVCCRIVDHVECCQESKLYGSGG